MSFKSVTIYYGPCDSFYTLDYKPQKLRGLRDRLQKLGYRVDLNPVKYQNCCILEICGHEVFRCNIQNLCFNLPHEQDGVCRRAVEACLAASVKLNRARTYLWFLQLLHEELFMRSEHSPKDYWLAAAEPPRALATCLQCAACCGLLARKKLDGE